MAEQVQEIGQVPKGLNEHWFGLLTANVPVTETDITLTPTVGTKWFVKKIEVYCAGAAAGMYYKLKRGGTDVTGNIYYGPSYGNITFDKVDSPTSNSIIVSVYTGSAAVEDVYINLQIYYQ